MATRIKSMKGWVEAWAGPGRTRGRYPVVAKERRTMDGITFRSRVEMTRYGQLRIAERAGMIRELRHATRFPLRVNGVLVGHYTCDFDYVDEHGRVIEELKTTGTAKETDYRLRKNLFQALYSELRFKEVVVK